MMRNSFSPGTIAGFELRADVSWLVGMALLALVLANGYLPMQYPNWSTGDVLVVSISIALFFSASIVAHELGHSLVSRKLGLPVPSIMLLIFGGFAQLKHDPQRPRDEFLIASAGPLVSLVLAHGFNGLRQILLDFSKEEKTIWDINWSLFVLWLIVTLIGTIVLVGGVRGT